MNFKKGETFLDGLVYKEKVFLRIRGIVSKLGITISPYYFLG